MSVTVRPFRNGGFEVDLLVRLATGRPYRERKVLKTSTSVAKRWGEARERELLRHGPTLQKKEVPTLRDFAPRFMEEHAMANRHKPSGLASKRIILRVHLVPALGSKQLDVITTEDVQRLKWRLRDKSAKTVNNVLTVLNVLLKKGVEWNVIQRMPCAIRLLPVTRNEAAFHDFEAYERLVEAARADDWRTYLIVLLGGEAGLRCGEMVALQWADVDFTSKQLSVRHSDYRGQLTTPKNGRIRYVNLTERLGEALQESRHLRSARVLCNDDGQPLTRRVAWGGVRRAARRAAVPSGVHILRHTFCSHLAMRGAVGKAIQELAGHGELSMTQRYMHLSPAALESAIRLLDPPAVPCTRGDSVETATCANVS